MNGETIIIAPHPDDEIIGCFEILTREDIEPIIIYTTKIDIVRTRETHALPHYTNIKGQLYLYKVPQYLMQPENTFYFPDPIYEIHPAHRKWGAIGEDLLRKGLDVIFYTTNMTAPYIHEVQNPSEKARLLDRVYMSQKKMWEYEAKYFLFEGRCKWMI